MYTIDLFYALGRRYFPPCIWYPAPMKFRARIEIGARSLGDRITPMKSTINFVSFPFLSRFLSPSLTFFFFFSFFFFFCQHFHSHTYNPRTLKVPFTRVCRNPRTHSTRVYTLVVYAFHFVQHSPCAFRATGWLRNLSSFLIIGLPLFFSFTRYFFPSFSVPFFFTIIFFFLEHPKNHESIR